MEPKSDESVVEARTSLLFNRCPYVLTRQCCSTFPVWFHDGDADSYTYMYVAFFFLFCLVWSFLFLPFGKEFLLSNRNRGSRQFPPCENSCAGGIALTTASGPNLYCLDLCLIHVVTSDFSLSWVSLFFLSITFPLAASTNSNYVVHNRIFFKLNL